MRPARPVAPIARAALALCAAALLAACQPTPVPPIPTPAATTTISIQPSPSSVAATTTPAPAANPSGAPTATPAPTPPHPADTLLDPWRFSYEPNFGPAEIQAFLETQPGVLKTTRFQVGGRSQSFADVLTGMSSLYSINPRVLLALLEAQSGVVSSAQPSGGQLALAMGFEGQSWRRGLLGQLRWAGIELRHAQRDYTTATSITFADGTTQPISGVSLPRYALSRMLALTTLPGRLGARLARFHDTYARLFGDPSAVPLDWPPPAAPFMRSPLGKPTWISSFFDHDTPFLQENGSLISYWGRTETQLSYDGHTGWDYALAPPDQVLAAAAGNVIFAGNSDDGCGIARAVILDHRNGYRSLYWHLDSIAVEAGQQVETGQELGIAGATGCVTGPHLHFQVQYLGRDVDPYGWCGGATPDPWAAAGAGQVSVWLWADRPSPCAPRPANAILVDDHDSGFFLSGTWQETPLGYGGGAHFIPSVRGDPVGSFDLQPLALPDVAVWRPKLPAPGSYRVRAYIPYILNGLNDARDTIYIVRHSQGETEVRIDGLIFANEWADLGTYHFDPGQTPQVTVSDRTADLGASIWADAIVWEPVP